MNTETLGEKILGMFTDIPLNKKEGKLFVNRGKEINKLINIGRFLQRSIYGIAGETGCGKTTLFNMLNFPEDITLLIITITEKESKEIIIADILYNLCILVIAEKKFKNVHSLARKVLKFLQEEEIKSKERGIKVGKILEGESKWAKTSKERYNINTIKNFLKEIINVITKESKVVLCIDEIDKERKEDAIVILDSIKDILK
ncbi:MAG: P-loop NTPase fold protein, partial [Bacteroidota bacterium]